MTMRKVRLSGSLLEKYASPRHYKIPSSAKSFNITLRLQPKR